MRIFIYTLFLATLLAVTLAAPLPAHYEPAFQELAERNLVGSILSRFGKGASKLPEKAGKQVGKEQGVESEESIKQTAARIADGFKKNQGQEQDITCVEGMVRHWMKWGGYNGNWPCTKPDPKKAAEDQKLREAKQKAFNSVPKSAPGIGAQMSEARAKAFGGKKRELD